MDSKKKFIFVDPSIDVFYYGVNLGVAHLAPLVRKKNFDVSLIYLPKKISGKEFRKRVEKIKPDIIGFSFMWPQIKHVIEYAKVIENIPNLIKIGGGPGASLAPEYILQKTSLSGVCIGEGEIPLDDFLTRINEKKDISETPGFYWKIGDQIKKNPIPQFVSDLSTIPYPDYSLYPDKTVVKYLGRHISIKLGRGCPYACTYCSNKELSSFYPSPHNYFRMATVRYSIDLIKQLLGQYPAVGVIDFHDEVFTANKEWFKEFIRVYAEEINLPYVILSRTESLDAEIVSLLKKSKCFRVWIGLESGDEEMRKKLLNRHYSNTEFIAKIKLLKDAGIEVFTYNMFGLPFETKEQMAKTVELNKTIKADRGQCSFYYPFPGTAMHRLCEENNLLLDEERIMALGNYNTRPTIKLTNASEKDCVAELKRLVDYFSNQEKNPWIRMSWFRFYEEDGTFKTHWRLSFYYAFLKIKFLIKKIGLIIDRQLGLIGIFLKRNSPAFYYWLKGVKN